MGLTEKGSLERWAEMGLIPTEKKTPLKDMQVSNQLLEISRNLRLLADNVTTLEYVLRDIMRG